MNKSHSLLFISIIPQHSTVFDLINIFQWFKHIPADLGGALGLMLGASIISIMEIGGLSLSFIYIAIKQVFKKLLGRFE